MGLILTKGFLMKIFWLETKTSVNQINLGFIIKLFTDGTGVNRAHYSVENLREVAHYCEH